MIGSEGNIAIWSLRHAPGFVDEDNRVLEHYKKVFDKMPKVFIPPQKGGLQGAFAAYTLSIFNRAHTEKIDALR